MCHGPHETLCGSGTPQPPPSLAFTASLALPLNDQEDQMRISLPYFLCMCMYLGLCTYWCMYAPMCGGWRSETSWQMLALSFHFDAASGAPLCRLHHCASLRASQQKPRCSEPATAALGRAYCTRLLLLLLLLFLLTRDSAWKGFRKPAWLKQSPLC